MATISQKDNRLDLRIQKAQKNFLLYAAALCGMNLSNFVLSSAFRAAEEIVTEKTHFTLSKKQWHDFCAVLDRPARDISGLRKLFSKPSVFDE